jgi:hypothetical protein
MTEPATSQPAAASEAVTDRARANDEEQRKLRYAFTVAIGALVALIVIRPVAAIVGTIVGAYLGHQAGAAGRARADADHREQTRVAQQLAAVADRTAAARILGIDLDTDPGTAPDTNSRQ